METKSVDEMMESDAETKAEASNDQLTELSVMINVMRDKERVLDDLEERVKMIQAEVDDISKNRIPDFFDQLGMDEIKLSTGEKVTIKRGFAAHISKANQEVAYAWLKKNNHGGIIKNEIKIDIKKGDEDEVANLQKVLIERGLTFSRRESVHGQTLKAFVTEQMTAGTDLPQTEFGVHPLRETKIKK